MKWQYVRIVGSRADRTLFRLSNLMGQLYRTSTIWLSYMDYSKWLEKVRMSHSLDL